MNKEKLVLECENDLSQEFKKIDEIEFYNSKKVLDAFHKESVVESDFNEKQVMATMTSEEIRLNAFLLVYSKPKKLLFVVNLYQQAMLYA